MSTETTQNRIIATNPQRSVLSWLNVTVSQQTAATGNEVKTVSSSSAENDSMAQHYPAARAAFLSRQFTDSGGGGGGGGGGLAGRRGSFAAGVSVDQRAAGSNANGWWRFALLRRDSVAPSESVMSSTTNHTESSPNSVNITGPASIASSKKASSEWRYRQSVDRQSVATMDDLSEVSPPTTYQPTAAPWPIISMQEQANDAFLAQLAFGGLNGSVVPERFLPSLYEKTRQSQARTIQRQIGQMPMEKSAHHSAFANLRRQSLPHTIEVNSPNMSLRSDAAYDASVGQQQLPAASQLPRNSQPALKRNNSLSRTPSKTGTSNGSGSGSDVASIIDSRSRKRVEDRRKRGMKRAATIGGSSEDDPNANEDSFSYSRSSAGDSNGDGRATGGLPSQSSVDSNSSKGKIRYSTNQKMRLSRKRSLLLKQKSLPSFLETVEEEGTVSSNEERLPRVDETGSEQSHKSGEGDKLKMRNLEQSAFASRDHVSAFLKQHLASTVGSFSLNAAADGLSARSAYSDCSTSRLSSDFSSLPVSSSSAQRRHSSVGVPAADGQVRVNTIEANATAAASAEFDDRLINTVSIEADDGELSPILCLRESNESPAFTSTYASIESDHGTNNLTSIYSEEAGCNRTSRRHLNDQFTQTEAEDSVLPWQNHAEQSTAVIDWLLKHPCIEQSLSNMCPGCLQLVRRSCASQKGEVPQSFACTGAQSNLEVSGLNGYIDVHSEEKFGYDRPDFAADQKANEDGNEARKQGASVSIMRTPELRKLDLSIVRESNEELASSEAEVEAEASVNSNGYAYGYGYANADADADADARQGDVTASRLGHSNTLPVLNKSNEAASSPRSVSICTTDPRLAQRRMRTMRWLTHRQSHVSSDEKEAGSGGQLKIYDSFNDENVAASASATAAAAACPDGDPEGEIDFAAPMRAQSAARDQTAVEKSLGDVFQVLLTSFDDAISAIDNLPVSPPSERHATDGDGDAEPESEPELSLPTDETNADRNHCMATIDEEPEAQAQQSAESKSEFNSEESILNDIQRLDEKFKQLREMSCPSPPAEALELLLSKMTSEHAQQAGEQQAKLPEQLDVSEVKPAGSNRSLQLPVLTVMPAGASPSGANENEYAEIEGQSDKQSPAISESSSHLESHRLYEDAQRIYEEMLREFQRPSRAAVCDRTGTSTVNDPFKSFLTPASSSAAAAAAVAPVASRRRTKDESVDWTRVENLVSMRIAQIKIEFYEEIRKLQEHISALQLANCGASPQNHKEHHYHTLHSSHTRSDSHSYSYSSAGADYYESEAGILPKYAHGWHSSSVEQGARAGFVPLHAESGSGSETHNAMAFQSDLNSNSIVNSNTNTALIDSLQSELGSLRVENQKFRHRLLDVTVNSIGRTLATVKQASDNQEDGYSD